MRPTPDARHAYAASPVSVPPPASPSPSKSRFFAIPRSSSPRPSQLQAQPQQPTMGHAQSAISYRQQSPPLPPTPASELPLNSPSSHAPTSKPKFAWPGRRKKSEDMGRILGRGTPSPPGTERRGKGHEILRSDTFTSDYESPESSASHEVPLARTQSRQSSAKTLTIHFANVLKGKIINASSTSISSPRTPSFSPNSSDPPPPPPKPENAWLSLSDRSRSSAENAAPFAMTNDKRASMQKPLPPTTPPATLTGQVQPQDQNQPPPPQADSAFRNDHHTSGMLVSATPVHVDPLDDVKLLGEGLIQGQVEGQVAEAPRRREKREDVEAQTAREIVEDWRKSDSTLRTVRLVGLGQRTPRPLSLAESTTSNQTILPGAGSPGANVGLNVAKRNSLIIDADFGPLEVESEDSDDDDDEVVFMRDNINSIPGSQQAYGVTASAESVNSSSAPPSAWQSVAARSRSPSPPSSATTNKSSCRGSFTFRSGRFSISPAAADRTPVPPPTDQFSGSDSEAMSSLSASTHSHARTASSSMSSVSFGSSSPGSGVVKDSVLTPTVGIVSSSTSTGSDFSHGITHNIQQLEQYEWAKQQASASQTSLSTSNSSHDRRPSQDTPYSPGSESDSVHSQAFSAAAHPSQVPHTSQPNMMRPAQQRSRLASINSKGFRQTAVSLTSGLAPAAGFAKGFGKRIGRALGGSVTNVSILPTSDQEMYGQGHGHSQSTIIGRSQSSVEQHVHSQNQGFFGRAQSRYTQEQSPSKKTKGKHASNASASSHSRPSFSDSDAAPRTFGPNLGKLVRPPFGGSGTRGLVFGRDLAQCVRDTAVGVGVPGWESYAKKRRSSTFSMDMEVVGAKALEGRRLPALVTRCAQHIEKWGIQEEGLFRISGRTTHIQRLRIEFDSGADYDMSECGPGEIDPHAVASVFKSYLRELPEPILTRDLIPYFEAALSTENSMMNAMEAINAGPERPRGPGLPTSPTKGNVRAQVRKPPSLSTFSTPALTPRAPSEPLLNALSALIARLPKENRDLLRTLTELMRLTAGRVKDTKMPLTNLILIFCPTLQMSGALLRVLCEGEGIWDGPPKGVQDPVVLDIKDEKADKAEKNEHLGEGQSELQGIDDVPQPLPAHSPNALDEDHDEAEHADGENEPALKSQRTIRRAKRASHTLSEDASRQATDTGTLAEFDAINEFSSPNDGSSSAGLHGKADSLRSDLYSPTAPTASSDSLSTPISSASASPAKDSIKLVHHGVGLHEASTIRAQLDLPSPSEGTVHKSVIGHPIPFPNDSASAPNTPIEYAPHLRLSTYSSSPNLGTGGKPSSPAVHRRRSKPSLQSLFPKRSLSSLLGRTEKQPATPVSDTFETAPQSRVVSSVCPVLEVPASTSPIKFEMGLGLTIKPRLECPEPVEGAAHDSDGGEEISRSSSNSSAVTSTSSVFYTPPTTSRPLPPVPALSSQVSTGSYSFIDLDLNKDTTGGVDDWASSVLQAADAGQTTCIK